ncbi:MAG: preprotein translocase subunit YajC [Actinomycetaceae bacterium]|nr:preprotein translocase subunit YajC [Actinomycetaceae bacterium]
MDPVILTMLLVGLLAMMYFSSRGSKKRMQEMQQLQQQLEPGTWVRTGSGMYGIVADVDGEVVILQTPRGEESYWNIKAINSVGEPPFASTQDEDENDLDQVNNTGLQTVEPELSEAADQVETEDDSYSTLEEEPIGNEPDEDTDTTSSR